MEEKKKDSFGIKFKKKKSFLGFVFNLLQKESFGPKGTFLINLIGV